MAENAVGRDFSIYVHNNSFMLLTCIIIRFMSHYSHYIMFYTCTQFVLQNEALWRVCVRGEKQFTDFMVNVSDVPDDERLLVVC